MSSINQSATVATHSSQATANIHKISTDKFAKLDLGVNTVKNINVNDVKVLQVEINNNIKKRMSDIKLEQFVNILIIEIIMKNATQGNIETLKQEINVKIVRKQPFLLKINSQIFLRNYYRNFKEISLTRSDLEIQRKINDSKFSTELFLNIQNNSNIFNWDFENFKKFNKSFEKFFIFALNSNDDFCLRLLNLFDLKFSQDIQCELLQCVLNTKNFEIFLAFLDVFEEKEIGKEKIEKLLNLKRGVKLFNPFLTAVGCKNLKVAEFLLKNSHNELKPFLDEARNLAIENEFFEIFSLPQSIFPRDANDVLQDIQNLHNSIKNGDLKEIENFTVKHPKLKLCYGQGNECALELAITHKQFEVFSFLRANNFYTDKGATLDYKIDSLRSSEKEKIRIENLKYIKDHPNAFIGFLLSKCKFDALSPISAPEVLKMLTDLSENDKLKVLLQRASEADLRIIFDFATESVKNMDPSADEHTMGLVYFKNGELYVGRDQSESNRYGTFVHELTHMILYILYENNCLPYCDGDTQTEILWNQILNNVNIIFTRNPQIEEIIRWVFTCYAPGYQQRAELAVRVNHILAKHLNNPQEVQNLSVTFNELFDFYDNFILPDLKIPNVLQIIKLNNDFGVIEDILNNKLELQPITATEFVNLTDKRLLIKSSIQKLALKKLYLELSSHCVKKLDLKVKNIFINPQNIFLKNDFLNLLKTSQIDRVIFDADDENVNIQELIEKVDKDIQVIVVCGLNSFTNLQNFNTHEKIFEWTNLTPNTQRKLKDKDLNFQGEVLKVSNFFQRCSNKVLPVLCSPSEIKVNCKNNVKMLKTFIPRTIVLNSVEFDVDAFLTNVKNEKFILISDIAGSGKTVFLQNLQNHFFKKHPHSWTSFIALREHAKILLESVNETFLEKMIKILNLSEIEKEIFLLKFSKGEARFLFDGYDEIASQCREELLKLIGRFNIENGGGCNQIYITTRRHLEHDLETELNVKSFELKLLSEDNQIKFLSTFWEVPGANKQFIKFCAVEAVRKISTLLKNHSNVIGVPLVIKIVGNLFINKINQNFINILDDIKLCDIYKEIIEEFLNLRYTEKLMKNSLKHTNILQTHEFLAIEYFFDKSFANKLCQPHNENEWPLEEIFQCGILSYDEKKIVYFCHLTYGEFLIANFMKNIIENITRISSAHIEIFKKILDEEKFGVSKMFLEEMFEKFEEKDLKFLTNLNENSLEFFKTFNRFILRSNIENFSVKYAKFTSNLPKHLASMLEEEKFENYLDNILSKDSERFLNLALNWDERDLKNSSLNVNLNDEELKPILMHQNSIKETILFYTAENFDKFQMILNSITKNVSKNLQKQLVMIKHQNGVNILQYLIERNENSAKIAFEFVANLMNKKEMEQFLREKNKSSTFMQKAAEHSKSKEIFEFLCEKVSEIVENPKEFFSQKIKNDRNVLELSLMNRNNPEIFCIAYNLVEKLCASKKEVKRIILEVNSENLNVLTMTVAFAPKSSLEFLLNKVKMIFDESELKAIMKTIIMKAKNEERNLLTLNAENKDFESIKFLWKFFENNLSKEEIFELLENKLNYSFLQIVSMAAKSDEILNFLWLKLKSMFTSDEELRSYLKFKTSEGRNVLLFSALNAELKKFAYIFDKIYCDHLHIKDFVYERDEKGENLLHKLARNGSSSTIEFTFNKLKEKLKPKELKMFIEAKNSFSNYNLYHCAAISNTHKNSISTLHEMIENFLDSSEVKTMLRAGKSYPIHIAIEFNKRKIFDEFTKLYEKYFTNIEIKHFLARKDLIDLASENREERRMKAVLQKYLSSLV